MGEFNCGAHSESAMLLSFSLYFYFPLPLIILLTSGGQGISQNAQKFWCQSLLDDYITF